jgi:hypothetical protein
LIRAARAAALLSVALASCSRCGAGPTDADLFLQHGALVTWLGLTCPPP